MRATQAAAAAKAASFLPFASGRLDDAGHRMPRHSPKTSWNGPYQSGYSSRLCNKMTPSRPHAISRKGSRSRHGFATPTIHKKPPQINSAAGMPSSTARCSGRL
ncbi:hypothetical protein D9M72_180290 [compost metagenome]